MGELTTIRTLAGLDIGQRGDYTALAVIEEDSENALTLVALERVRHLSYPKVAELVRDTMADLGWPTLLVDVTGVGRPVTDQLDVLGVRHTRINIHGGHLISTLDDGTQSVPKRDLIGALAVGFESKRLRIAAGLKHVEHLEREAQAFTMKLSASGHDTYNAREGEHDDLLLAVALPVWLALQVPHGFSGGMFTVGAARDSRASRGGVGGVDHWIGTPGGGMRPARRRLDNIADLFS